MNSTPPADVLLEQGLPRSFKHALESHHWHMSFGSRACKGLQQGMTCIWWTTEQYWPAHSTWACDPEAETTLPQQIERSKHLSSGLQKAEPNQKHQSTPARIKQLHLGGPVAL